jgi:hypothetical protein
MKKLSQHSACLMLCASLLLVSCQKDYAPITSNKVQQTLARATEADQLRHSFARGLAAALHESPELRTFIKEEALKMFNYDYDVPYHLVKHQKLIGGKTLRETLAPHFEHPETLATIELSLPLLTLFVPTLPENSFSAESWNAATEVPHVAVRLTSSNSVPLVDYEGNEMLLSPELIPSFPVVVVKDNERLVSDKQKEFAGTESTRILTGAGGRQYKLVDDIFDRELQEKKGAGGRMVSSSLLDPKLLQAWNIYNNKDGWQRDYIYYNITPQNPNGEFVFDFVESIRSFKFTGDAYAIYQAIADQTGDPLATQGASHTGSYSGWTDGLFDIRATILIQARNGIGDTFRSYYLVTGSNLFTMQYDSRFLYSTLIPRRTYRYYYVVGATAKPQTTNLAFIGWDLSKYGATLRIDVEESDRTEEVEENVSQTSKFASNFGLEGTLKKLGLKFGASAEVTRTDNVTRRYTLESDPLGSVLVNFADKVIITQPCTSYPCLTTFHLTREYDNGVYSISVEPTRIQ